MIRKSTSLLHPRSSRLLSLSSRSLSSQIQSRSFHALNPNKSKISQFSHAQTYLRSHRTSLSSSLSPLRSSASKSSKRFFATTPSNWGFAIVPQQSAYVIERFGKFNRVLSPGLALLIPFVDRIAYVHSLKEEAIHIPNQTAITADNVVISIDGVLYLRINDPVKASYGISNILFAMTQLAQTMMRSELGKITLDKTFTERDSLNQSIVVGINKASDPWGITCLRYEIRDITPPASVKNAMDQQAEAERKKRATILDSEGAAQAAINSADSERQASILSAQGEAASIIAVAEANARAIERLTKAVNVPGGKEAVSLRVAERYIDAFANIAKQGNTLLLPANVGDSSAMVAQAMAIFGTLSKHNNSASSSSPSSPSSASSSAPLLDASNDAYLDELLKSVPAAPASTSLTK